MNIKEFSAHVIGGVLAHWVSGLVILAVSFGIPYWGRIQEQWAGPTAITVGIVLFAAALVIFRTLIPDRLASIPTHIRLQYNQQPNLPLEQVKLIFGVGTRIRLLFHQ